MENAIIKNSKGQNIAAVIQHPAQQTEKLAILCPGYLDTKDYDHLVKLASALTAKGYTTVRFDPTGTWESEGDISEYLTSQYLADIKSVLEHMLGEHRYTDILLGGHSRGGMVSILYAADDTRITKVLGIMPSSGRTFVGKRREEWEQKGFSISNRNIPGERTEKEFKVPFSHVIDREKFDVVEKAKNLHSSLVLIAGEKDVLVPPEDVKEIYDGAPDPKKFILIKGVGHDYRQNPAQIEKVNQEILKAL